MSASDLLDSDTTLMRMFAGKLTLEEVNEQEAILVNENIDTVTGSCKPKPAERALTEEEKERIEEDPNDYNLDVYVRSVLGIRPPSKGSLLTQLER